MTPFEAYTPDKRGVGDIRAFYAANKPDCASTVHLAPPF